MLEALIAVGGVIVVAGVLWLRPWVDDYRHPYDWRRIMFGRMETNVPLAFVTPAFVLGLPWVKVQGTSDHLWGDSLLKELDLVAALVVNLLMITLMLLDLYGIIDFGAFHWR